MFDGSKHLGDGNSRTFNTSTKLKQALSEIWVNYVCQNRLLVLIYK